MRPPYNTQETSTASCLWANTWSQHPRNVNGSRLHFWLIAWFAKNPNEREGALYAFHFVKCCAASLQTSSGGIRDSLRRGAGQAAGAAPTLRYGPAGDSAPSAAAQGGWYDRKVPFRPVHTARMPRFGPWCNAIERYQMRYKNHWLISASPLFPHKQSSLRIGPEPSRARSEPLTARTDPTQ